MLDPFLSAYRERNVQAGIADGVMYTESFSLSLSFALTNIVKIAVRRPRPIAYQEAEAHRGDPTYSNSDPDSALSFFSNHSSTVAALGATATYLASRTLPAQARPWITLVASTLLTTFVSYERVRAGAHFPTDGLAGAGVGLIVPHLHRSGDIQQRRVWLSAVGHEHLDCAPLLSPAKVRMPNQEPLGDSLRWAGPASTRTAALSWAVATVSRAAIDPATPESACRVLMAPRSCCHRARSPASSRPRRPDGNAPPHEALLAASAGAGQELRARGIVPAGLSGRSPGSRMQCARSLIGQSRRPLPGELRRVAARPGRLRR